MQKEPGAAPPAPIRPGPPHRRPRSARPRPPPPHRARPIVAAPIDHRPTARPRAAHRRPAPRTAAPPRTAHRHRRPAPRTAAPPRYRAPRTAAPRRAPPPPRALWPGPVSRCPWCCGDAAGATFCRAVTARPGAGTPACREHFQGYPLAADRGTRPVSTAAPLHDLLTNSAPSRSATEMAANASAAPRSVMRRGHGQQTSQRAPAAPDPARRQHPPPAHIHDRRPRRHHAIHRQPTSGGFPSPILIH